MKPLKHSKNSPRSGAALVMGLMVVVVIMFLGGSFSHFASVITRSSVKAVDRKRAFYVAEAGLAEAYAGMLQAKSGNIGSLQDPALFGDGLFWVEATELAGTDMVELKSIGMVAGGRAELEVVVQKGETSVTSLGLYADEALSILPGTTVDSYNSAKGAYDDPVQVRTNGVIGSNKAISVSGTENYPTTIRGAVTPGPNQAVAVDGVGVTITGSTSPALETAPLPDVTTPDVEFLAGMTYTNPAPLIIPPGTRGAQFLTLASNAQATIVGPSTIVLGELTLDPSSQLTFDTSGGPIELYVLDDMTWSVDSQVITTDTDPSQISIQFPGETSEPVKLGATATFHGTIYAPKSRVLMASNFQLFGALIGSELMLLEGAQLHFDEHLAELAAEMALPKQVSWQVLDLESPTGDLFADPFKVLGVNRNALRKPGDAHEDQWLDITYTDTGGTSRTYSGQEAGFDWTQVGDLSKGIRDGEEFVLPGDTRTGNVKDPATGVLNPDPDLAALNDPDEDLDALYTRLVASSPLSEEVMQATINRDPSLRLRHLKEVLLINRPLSPESLRGVIHRSPLLDAQIADVLIGCSPLSAAMMTSLLARDPPLATDAYTAVVNAQ